MRCTVKDLALLGNLMIDLSVSRHRPIFHRIVITFSASPKGRGSPEVRQRHKQYSTCEPCRLGQASGSLTLAAGGGFVD